MARNYKHTNIYKNVGGGAGNHLKYYLRVPKNVTREEAYTGGQKLQTYIYSSVFICWSDTRVVTGALVVKWNLQPLLFEVEV